MQNEILEMSHIDYWISLISYFALLSNSLNQYHVKFEFLSWFHRMHIVTIFQLFFIKIEWVYYSWKMLSKGYLERKPNLWHNAQRSSRLILFGKSSHEYTTPTTINNNISASLISWESPAKNGLQPYHASCCGCSFCTK